MAAVFASATHKAVVIANPHTGATSLKPKRTLALPSTSQQAAPSGPATQCVLMFGSERLLRTRDLADIAFENSEAVHASANVVARL